MNVRLGSRVLAFKPSVVIDIDGTIFEHDGNYVKNQWGKHLPGVHEAFHKFKKKGYEIVLFTAREEDERPALEAHLKQQEIPYDRLEFGKPKALVYIDDRGFKFESWDRVPETFE